MKTAISLPDDLFVAVDALARKLGIARSRLVAEALAEYVAKHRHGRVTEQLDAVYTAEPSAVDEPVRRAQRRVLKRSDWDQTR
jgi:metal-responsive CopG/Arc/MetJ family transcriptional regulator